MKDNIFELMEYDSDGKVQCAKYQGAWLVVDNGYLSWPTTIPPMTQSVLIDDTRWSEWMESMRKDVECTFRILKGRFRILKAGIRVKGVDAADKIWMTCCAIHNMLLEIDGLTEDWSGQLGLFDFDKNSEHIPFALQRLENPSLICTYDS